MSIGGGLRRRIRRTRGLVGVGWRRVVGRATGPDGSRTRLGVAGVAIAVAVVVIVTAVGAGLAAGATVHGSDVDYWIVPEGGGGAALVDTGGPGLGSSHEVSDRLREREDVTYATPVLTEPIRLEAPAADGADAEREIVLAVGVIGGEDPPRIAGLSPAALEPDDPHYANGSYDGRWTGDLVAAPATATLLDVEAGDGLGVAGGDATFTVREVDEGVAGPTQDTPIVLVQLSELQAITGSAGQDEADQLLVETTDRSVREDLAGIYPETTVETRSGLLASGTVDEELPLALAGTGLLVALVVGSLFVCTTLGMEVVADSRAFGTLAAIGIGHRGRLVVVATQVLSTTFIGGVLGAGLGLGGIAFLNHVAAWRAGIGEIAVLHPLFAGYGVLVAVLIGICSLPYLLVLVRRIGPGEVIGSD